jgi:DNA topoisomerase-1
MVRKYTTKMLGTTLVLVESPAKCKKIEEYLGPGYKCMASYGHLREIKTLSNIDFDNNFTPTYTIIDNAIKKKQIENIRREIGKSSDVILASDNDREGEKISFCLAQIFNLDINKTKRITFNEITESAIQEAVKKPRLIDMDIVNAQQARQILDLVVGYKVTPMLWKCISKTAQNSLSAGRCQTPALKLIYDNYQDINQNNERNVYNTVGYFTNQNISFDLNKQFETDELMTDFLDESVGHDHVYTCSKPVKVCKKQPEPFTTSSLQQSASNELHYTPKETMRICQLLYEGGYITYMRTDSKTYSQEFVDSAKVYIQRNYEDKYINEAIDQLVCGNTKNKLTNDLAHEAIRPTNISLVEHPGDSKEKRMYKLIWENTLESCMTASSFNSITANISAFQNAKFTYTSELNDFPGWKIVSKKYLNEIKKDNKEYQYLQTIKQNSILKYKKMTSKVTIKGLKQHYTEARLVQLLEERGIGRPSTFSSLVDKIQERCYVKREDIKGREIMCKDYELENDQIFEIETKREFGNEKNKLVIQPLGIIVMEFLDKHFTELFNYDYTKSMEDELDKITKGEIVWHELCRKCNDQVDLLVNNLKNENKFEIKIDEHNTYIIGKYGPVIKFVETIDGKETTTFKKINKDANILEGNIDDIVEKHDESTSTDKDPSFINLGKYENSDVILRKGKYGLYISWGTSNKRTLKELGNRPMESITFDEIEKYLKQGNGLVREISSSVSIRNGPKGDYIFYKKSNMKTPKFHSLNGFKEDYKICDITILKSWINDTYGV